MRNVFDRHITCAFLYSITRYGYPPDAEHMVTYVHEMADLGFQSIELEGIGEAHLKEKLHKRVWIYLKQAVNSELISEPEGYWITALLFLMNFRQICLFTGIIHRTYFVMCVCRKDCRGKYIGTICCLGWIQLANLRQIMG